MVRFRRKNSRAGVDRAQRLGVSLALFCFLVATPCVSMAHNDGAYSHDSANVASNADWMRDIPGSYKVNQISIPGTHDSGAFYGGDSTQTQSMSITKQLVSGIRFLDIRLKSVGNNQLQLYHGIVSQQAKFDSVLNEVTVFLKQHPTEVVFMRVKNETNNDPSPNVFQTAFLAYYKQYSAYFWSGGEENPKLGDVRGKIVVFSDGPTGDVGTSYHQLDKQDYYALTSNWDLYNKWEKVKAHIQRAATATDGRIYLNYLSGSTGSFPYFVASGHSSPATGAARLSTGRTTPGWKDSYPDFPRVNCFIGICTIAFEGINTLTAALLQVTNAIPTMRYKNVGIIVADFPGASLINAVIAVNRLVPINSPITSQLNGKCLDVRGVNASPGTVVQMWSCGGAGSANQQWYSSGAEIKSKLNNLCLDISGSFAGDGGKVIMWTCNGAINQQWYFDGLAIRSKLNGKCLDISGGNTNNGADVVTWTCNGGANQKWEP